MSSREVETKRLGLLLGAAPGTARSHIRSKVDRGRVVSRHVSLPALGVPIAQTEPPPAAAVDTTLPALLLVTGRSPDAAACLHHAAGLPALKAAVYTRAMDLPAPVIVGVHAVFGLATTLPFKGDIDERLVASLSGEFPNVVSRQLPLPGSPLLGPRLILTSSSSQLVVSAAQLDFDVQFYGDFLSNSELGLKYVRRKLDAIRTAIDALGERAVSVGLIGKFNFSFKNVEADPVEHIIATHLRSEVPPNTAQDAGCRVALRVRDKYFVNFNVANYEARVVQRPMLPGPQQVIVKPWEGEVSDSGVELTVDINNTLEARSLQKDPVITAQGVEAVLELFETVLGDVGPQWALNGELSADVFAVQPA